MQKILIVEDDVDIQDILKNHLIDAGYEVAVASDGVVGIAMFDDTIDLILLDIMLPKIDGYGVCEVIRKKSQVPIIMLTALSDEENQLKGFEQQIDDYIPKPFSPKILLCKIAAILRRRTTENQNQSLLTYKELSMDIDGFHVYQSGNEVVLTSKEFALLRIMIENQGKVFTRQMLLERLWSDDLEVEDRIVDSHIKNLRKKLSADYIKTIRGVGYRIDKVHQKAAVCQDFYNYVFLTGGSLLRNIFLYIKAIAYDIFKFYKRGYGESCHAPCQANDGF